MRRYLALGVALLLGACGDSPAPTLPIEAPRLQASASDEAVVVYPRDDSTFWVYDGSPEFGIGTHLWEPKDLEGMRGMNARFVRNTMMWSQWHTHYDQMLAWWDFVTTTNHFTPEFEPIILVHSEPPGYGWKNREAAFDLLARDLAWFAKRYPQIRYYELFNEMNVGFGTLFGQHLHDWNGEVDRWVPYFERGQIYAQMLKKVVPALREANPNAWVVFGGVTPSYRGGKGPDLGAHTGDNYHPEEVADFIRGVYAAGGRDYFDVMNVHSYGTPLAGTFIDIGEHVRSVMRQYDDEKKPMINTEFGSSSAEVLCQTGWPADGLQGFDRVQLEQIRGAYEAASKSRLYWKVLPYNLQAEAEMHWCDAARTAQTERTDVEWNDYSHGLVRWDRIRRRPAYDWIASYTATRQPAEGRTVDVRIEYPDGRVITRADVPVGVRFPHVLRISGLD